MTTTDHPLFSRRFTQRRVSTFIVDTTAGAITVRAKSVGEAVTKARKQHPGAKVLGTREP